MMKSVLRFLLPLVVLTVTLLGGCAGSGAAQETWAVCIYMCGSDLESESGFATENL